MESLRVLFLFLLLVFGGWVHESALSSCAGFLSCPSFFRFGESRRAQRRRQRGDASACVGVLKSRPIVICVVVVGATAVCTVGLWCSVVFWFCRVVSANAACPSSGACLVVVVVGVVHHVRFLRVHHHDAPQAPWSSL